MSKRRATITHRSNMGSKAVENVGCNPKLNLKMFIDPLAQGDPLMCSSPVTCRARKPCGNVGTADDLAYTRRVVWARQALDHAVPKRLCSVVGIDRTRE